MPNNEDLSYWEDSFAIGGGLPRESSSWLSDWGNVLGTDDLSLGVNTGMKHDGSKIAGSFFDNLWNAAGGVFKTYVDYERVQSDMDLRRQQIAADIADRRDVLRRLGFTGDAAGGTNLLPFLLIGGAGLLAFAALRR